MKPLVDAFAVVVGLFVGLMLVAWGFASAVMLVEGWLR